VHRFGVKADALEAAEMSSIVASIFGEKQPQNAECLLKARDPLFPGHAKGGTSFRLPAERYHQGEAPIGDDIKGGHLLC
jgi:hypothetical protein